ncbi:GlcNAc-transferase family protein [Pantoea sp. MBD-2R]|uniref:GlcNAc-transferase family protein n=1 Tax=Pantoea sp. MBD-2R TaxID=3141540 RepID=UPI003183FE35
MNAQPGIFVSIASYRDAELLPTLHNMLEKASGLSALNITVCWQDDGDISLFQQAGFTLCEKTKSGEHDLFIFAHQGNRLQILCIDYFLSEGACWARSLCEKLYQQEDYCLQIDSHCRFIDGWDIEMISLLQQMKQHSAKPIISSYPPGYQPGKEDEKAEYVSRLVLRGFSSEKILQLTSVDFQSNAPVRGSYLAGGFIFAEARFLREVPNDPLIFFEGEEIAMAVRAFTHGYDIWHPHKILLWHFYGRENHARIWSDHNDEAEKAGSISCVWWERDRLSKKRVKVLLGIEKEACDPGHWGLGNERSLGEFEYAAGISFQHCIALPEVMGKDRIAWFPGPPKEGWQSRLTATSNKTVTIARQELGCEFDELAWLHVGIYSSNNDLLQKKTLFQAEIDRALALEGGEEMSVTLSFTTSFTLQPWVIRISPYLHSAGWGNVVERSW